jgi:hypothetical protein
MTSIVGPEARTASAVRVIEHYALSWRGIDVRIVYDPRSTGTTEYPYEHLEVMSDLPRQPLPITETGYKSLFLPAGSIAAQGGPLAFVSRWLDHAASAPQWKAVERDRRQGNLF